MSKIILSLSNDSGGRDIVFSVKDTNIARKWQEQIAQGYPIFEDWRFTGWPNSKWTAESYIVEINKCVDLVNDYMPDTITGSNDPNHLHKFFEVLRGPLESPTQWYLDAPVPVQQAVNDFNILIHNYEKLIQSKHLSPTITCTFKCPRYELDEDDYQHFTYHWKFGTIYINYCEVGKHLLELYGDNDNVVGEDNIRPLRYYSADFKLKFFTDVSVEEFNKWETKFKAWLAENKPLFEKLGFKHLSLGLIPVATLDYDANGFCGLSQEEIINQLHTYTNVRSVKVLV